MIKQECIGIPDMILLLMIFFSKKIKIKAEIVLSPGGAYFTTSKHPLPPKIDRFDFTRVKRSKKWSGLPTSHTRVSLAFWYPL